jgi:hypothetical protein
VSNLTYVSPTSLTATFTIASNAALGSRDVYVTNPDGGRATGVKVFKVADLPGKVANLTATAGDKQASLTWTAPSNGGSSILDYTITCSPSCGNVIVSGSATSATVSGLSNGTTYTFRIRARNDVGTGEFSNPSNAVTPIGPEGEYVPVVPFRVYDTREADGPKMGSGTGAIRTVKVAGKGSVPTSGVSAVVLNITAINPTATAGNLRVYPADGSVPNTVTVTYRLGETVANLTEVNVSGGNGANSGSVKIFNSAGTVHVAVDVVGYFSDGRQGSPEGDHFFEAGPKRVVDTRNGVGTADAPMTAGETGIRTFDLHADSAVPDDATAVVVNVTATSAPKSGYVSLYPADATRPGVSNINVRAGQTVANLAVVKLGGGTSSTLGKIKAFSSGGTHLILDLVGYYSAVEGGAKFKGVSPARLATTVGGTKLAAGAIRSFKVAGVGPVPGPSVVRSVVIAVQAVNPEKLGFLQVWPSGAAPTTSVVNFPAGRNTLNLVVADIDENGFIKVRNGSQGATHVIIDVVGYNAVDVG